jgi:uncharacterized protein with FMN-binding domain
MKKYILSTLVVSTFIIYVLYQQINGTNSTIFVNSIDNSSTKKLSSFDSEKTNNQIVKTPKVLSNTIQKVTPASTVVNKGLYKDGVYTGSNADAYYGNIQVQVTVSAGKLSDIKFLDHPQDRNRSIEINNHAMPLLASEAIQIQSANVDTISGATDSSGAFRESLGSALSQALNS